VGRERQHLRGPPPPFADFYEDGTEAAYSYHSFFSTPQGKSTYAAAQLGLALPGDVVNIGPM
jgi:hypothetical protein